MRSDDGRSTKSWEAKERILKGIFGFVTLSFVAATFAITPVRAQQASVALARKGTQIYRLKDSSFYTEGCISPCACPVRLYDEIRGTFKVKLARQSSTAAMWLISNINWLVTAENEELYITGGGRLSLGNGSYNLQLDLDFGDETVSYVSGPVKGVGEFPGNLSVELVVPGASCFTTTFRIDAAELSIREIRNYRLQDSVYASGCGLDPNHQEPGCLCPVQAQNLVGEFGAVSLGLNSNGFNEYSLVNMELAAAAFTTPPFEQFDIFGDAIYRLTEPPVCPGPPCLIVLFKEAFGRFTFGDSVQTIPMRSELVIGGGEFPRIEIGVLDELPGCYGHFLSISASPLRSLR